MKEKERKGNLQTKEKKKEEKNEATTNNKEERERAAKSHTHGESISKDLMMMMINEYKWI